MKGYITCFTSALILTLFLLSTILFLSGCKTDVVVTPTLSVECTQIQEISPKSFELYCK